MAVTPPVHEIERFMSTSPVFRNPWKEYLSRFDVQRDLDIATYQEDEPGFPVLVAGATYVEGDPGARLDALGSMVEAITQEQAELVRTGRGGKGAVLRSEWALILLYQFGHLDEVETQGVLYKAGRPVPEDDGLTTDELENRTSPSAFADWADDPGQHPVVELAGKIRAIRSW